MDRRLCLAAISGRIVGNPETGRARFLATAHFSGNAVIRQLTDISAYGNDLARLAIDPVQSCGEGREPHGVVILATVISKSILKSVWSERVERLHKLQC